MATLCVDDLWRTQQTPQLPQSVRNKSVTAEMLHF